MPFGSIFGALFFGLFCTLVGLRFIAHPLAAGRVCGLLFVALGLSLAAGLLMGRSWARWTGVPVSLALAAFGLRLIAAGGGLVDHALVFAALATTVLLIVPASGRPGGDDSSIGPRRAQRIDPVGWTAIASGIGLLVLGSFAVPQETVQAAGQGTLPVSAISRSVRWSEFGPGLERAQAESKPVLATFVTDWCPYCTKMARSTWRAAAVAERLEELVTVKVDAEGDRPTGGFTGRQLAERYGVSGYPAQLLLSPDGAVVARHDGYQTARQLLDWVARSLGPAQVDSTASFSGALP